MSDALAVGSVFAGYRIEGLIGSGGMGVVYRAQEVHLGRTVALKVLAAGRAADESFRERFIRESRTLASLEHPNIVGVYRADEADGQLFLAMRYIDGYDLGKLIKKEGPLALARVVHLIGQVANALDEAHKADLVHRDVKPGNILIRPAREGRAGEQAFLSDFGLTKLISSDSGLTTVGQFLGTPAYVAPEQIQGFAVDGRADQYALACVVVECLTGRPPYADAGDAAVLMAHLMSPPPSIHERAQLPPMIDRVVARAMSKARDQRYESCAAFVGALAEAIPAADAMSARSAGTSAAAATRVDLAPATLVDDGPPTVLAGDASAPVLPDTAPPAPPPAPTDDSPPTVVPPGRQVARPRRQAATPAVTPPVAATAPPASPVEAPPSPAQPSAPGSRPVAEPAARPPSAPPAGPVPAGRPDGAAPRGAPAQPSMQRRAPIFVAVGAAVVVLLVVVGFFVASGGAPGPTATPAERDPGPTAVTATVSATLLPTVDPGGGFPDEADRRLLQRVPLGLRRNCGEAELREDDTPEAQRLAIGAARSVVECRPSGAITRLDPSLVRYLQFDDPTVLAARFDGLLAAAHAEDDIDDNQAGKCSQPPNRGGHGTYRYIDFSGRLMCYRDGQGSAVLVWSVDSLRIIVIAARTDGEHSLLHEWWTDPAQSGPLG